MTVFVEPALKAFEDRVAAHLKRCFPRQSEALGEAKVHEVIHYGIQRAKSYGIIAERDVCKYIDLMIVFGRDFDKDPQLGWPAPILNNKTVKDPALRIKRLLEAGQKDPKATGANRG